MADNERQQQYFDINSINVNEKLPQSGEQRVPFAFDLQVEYENAQRFGDSYKDYFLEQANHYAGEHYGKVPVSWYRHYLSKDSNGNVALLVGPQRDLARESYEKPAGDTSLPDWYRHRASADGNWTISIEEQLKNAKEGDIFIDMSPTEFNVDIKERKKWAFGWHSFIRLHQLINENGQEVIVSKAIRNYLDLPEQVSLFKQFSGKDVNPSQLLGSVAKLPEGVNAGHVKKIADDAYNNTPLGRKIIPEGDEISKDELEMNNILKNAQPWLERIFYMMKHRISTEIIEKEFHAWEMSVKDAVKGVHVDMSFFTNLNLQDFSMNSTDIQASPIGIYLQTEYTPVAGSCGNGSGFKNKNNPYGIPGLVLLDNVMTYQSMTMSSKKNKKDWSYHPGKCVDCGAGENPAGKNSVEVGPCEICKKCEAKYDAKEAANDSGDEGY